jgi:putative polyhydroxyalkanoate system protein
MSTLHVSHTHGLGAQVARARLDDLAARLAGSLQASCSWVGEELQFSRQGVTGRVEVTDDAVQVRIVLEGALRALRAGLAREVQRQLREALR